LPELWWPSMPTTRMGLRAGTTTTWVFSSSTSHSLTGTRMGLCIRGRPIKVIDVFFSGNWLMSLNIYICEILLNIWKIILIFQHLNISEFVLIVSGFRAIGCDFITSVLGGLLINLLLGPSTQPVRNLIPIQYTGYFIVIVYTSCIDFTFNWHKLASAVWFVMFNRFDLRKAKLGLMRHCEMSINSIGISSIINCETSVWRM